MQLDPGGKTTCLTWSPVLDLQPRTGAHYFWSRFATLERVRRSRSHESYALLGNDVGPEVQDMHSLYSPTSVRQSRPHNSFLVGRLRRPGTNRVGSHGAWSAMHLDGGATATSQTQPTCGRLPFADAQDARGPCQAALRVLCLYAAYWAAWLAARVTERFAASSPNSRLTQHVPLWAWQTALASGPLVVAVAITVARIPLHHLCVMPRRAYWTLLVPGCVCWAAAVWLNQHQLPAFFGMSAGLAQAMRPLLVAQLGVIIGVQAASAAIDAAAMSIMAALGLLPLLPLLLRPSAGCALAAQLASSCLAPVLLQALMLQQDAAGVGVLPLLVHVRGWRMVAVQLHLLASVGTAAAPWSYLNLPWLLLHSCVVVSQEWLGLLLVRDTGATTFELFAVLAMLPYPAVWGAVMAQSPGQRTAFIVSLAGSYASLVVVAVRRRTAACEGGGGGGGMAGFGSKGSLRSDLPAGGLLGTLSRTASAKQCSPELIA